METLAAMSHPGIESFSAFQTPDSSSSDPLSHAAYPAVPASERVSTPLQHVEPSTNLNESVPNSQDTHVSSSSKASAGSQLASDSSSLSNASFDTSSTSPISLKASLVQNSSYLPLPPPQIARPITPEVRNALKDVGSEGLSSNSTSPMSVDSQHLKQGSKRTASGALKASTVGSGNFSDYSVQASHSQSAGRARSSSRAAEISAQLKTRLSYAMVKVQHGWEHHSIDQLERATSQPSTPMIPSTPISETPGRRRMSVYSETSDRYFQSPTLQSSPQQFTTSFRPQQHTGPGFHYYPTATSMPANGPSLAPAAPISPARPGRRSISSRVPPNLMTSRIPLDMSGQPTTHTSNPSRQGILRMPSQQAEKDALETLMFMSSPNNSSNLKYAASAASSPLRSEFPSAAKKVLFDGHF